MLLHQLQPSLTPVTALATLHPTQLLHFTHLSITHCLSWWHWVLWCHTVYSFAQTAFIAMSSCRVQGLWLLLHHSYTWILMETPLGYPAVVQSNGILQLWFCRIGPFMCLSGSYTDRVGVGVGLRCSLNHPSKGQGQLTNLCWPSRGRDSS